MTDNVQTAYTYDGRNRLKTVTKGGVTTTYAYDANNNRLSDTTSDGSVTEYAYDDDGRLVTVTKNGQVTDTYSYNALGAMTAHNGDAYAYDDWDRLVRFTPQTGAATTYAYDAEGIRVAKNATHYANDLNKNVAADSNGGQMLWGNSPIAREVNGQWYYYITNAHGDVLALVDDSGTVRNTYQYDAWGDTTQKHETVDNPFRYNGQFTDDETGLIYLRSRYYDPKAGRFTSEDGARDGMNWYAYCGNNPVNFMDPSGKAKEGDDKYTLDVQEEIAVYGQVWADAEVAFANGIINLLEKNSVQLAAETSADRIRYQADHPFLSFAQGAVEFAAFEILLGDIYGGTVYAADLSGSALEKMYGNEENLKTIVNMSPMISVAAAVNASEKGRTILNTKINGKMTRVDIEFPQGKKPANLHVQIKGTGQKVMISHIDDLAKLPKGVANNKAIIKAVQKGLKLLSKLF